MDVTQESFGIILKILSFFRMYSKDESKKLNKIQAYSTYIFLGVLFTLLNIQFCLFGEQMEQDQMILNMLVATQTVSFDFKLLPFISRGSELKKCIHYFDTFYFTPSTEDLEIIKECVKNCRRNSKMVLGIVIVLMVGFGIKPLIIRDTMFPVDMVLPFEAKTGVTYLLVYTYQIAAATYLGVAGVMADPLIGGLAYQGVTQLVVLQMNLKNLSEYAEEEFLKRNGNSSQKSKIVQNLLDKKIEECVQHYDAILRFISEFENCFSFALFGQFACSAIVICFGCLYLSTTSSVFSFMTLLNVGASALVLGQIYFFCYYGTLLYEENKKISDAVYSSKWYEYGIKSRKALMIMMELSNKPFIITTGKVIELSLATFTTVLRMSYSLLAVLKNYQ